MKGSPKNRAAKAIESFQNAAATIGPIERGMHVFAITRGQFSMIDAVSHALAFCGNGATLTLWTWVIADYETTVFRALAERGEIANATLVIDHGFHRKETARESHKTNAAMIALWRERFGSSSVRYVVNHAKIATVEGNGLRVLLRGSMNLNFNPRFEQLDVSEGCAGFDLVRRIESDLPVLQDGSPHGDAVRASKLENAFDATTLELFKGLKTWAK